MLPPSMLKKSLAMFTFEQPKGRVNLGYMNEWRSTPGMVETCKAEKHKVFRTNDYVRCCETVVCEKCNYIYKIDSSD